MTRKQHDHSEDRTQVGIYLESKRIEMTQVPLNTSINDGAEAMRSLWRGFFNLYY